ncbi:hypothetical protein [Nocardia grenadensis]|uniref:hypothetical protein n=1 Tax=Nocardia grenadensis TaxID=931537 RepID=UPI003D8BD5EA
MRDDFLVEVFAQHNPVYLGAEVNFLDWSGCDEYAYNLAQADVQDFYMGDHIFAQWDRGKVELFDLLKVDHSRKKTYVIHTKKGFAAATRDACSQIKLSADVIRQDLRNGRKILTDYYLRWRDNDRNGRVGEAEFLSWFDYELVFVVLCSTAQKFVPADFTNKTLHSHIARQEILATRRHMGSAFRLAHTRSTR